MYVKVDYITYYTMLPLKVFYLQCRTSFNV